MLKLTQSNIDPGNCWQTAVACLLEVQAEALPPQIEIEAASKSEARHAGHYSYSNALQCYLKKHYSLCYVELPCWQLTQANVFGSHMIIGPTIRTAAALERGLPHVDHVVLGLNGDMIWDVHPSRAGLTSFDRFGFLLKTPPAWAENPKTIAAQLKNWREGRRDSIMSLCCCPLCFTDGEYQ